MEYAAPVPTPPRVQQKTMNNMKYKTHYPSFRNECCVMPLWDISVSQYTVVSVNAQTKVNNSEAVLNLLHVEVSALRDRVALLEKEEMQRAFEKAEQQKVKEEEERRQQQKNQEAKEEEQMNKLLVDLGRVTSQQEQTSARSSNPAVISLPKLEAGVNPLYVSTLHEFDSSDATFVNFNIQGNHGEVPSSNSHHQKTGEVQLLNISDACSTKTSKDGEAGVSISKDSSHAMTVHNKPKDPFDFVMDEVKSELKVKPSRQTRNTVQKNSGPLKETNHASSSKTTSHHQDRDKNLGHGSSHRNLEISKPDTSKANGHVIHDDHNGDEHDGPASSGDSPPAPSLSDDVTISSSPVF